MAARAVRQQVTENIADDTLTTTTWRVTPDVLGSTCVPAMISSFAPAPRVAPLHRPRTAQTPQQAPDSQSPYFRHVAAFFHIAHPHLSTYIHLPSFRGFSVAAQCKLGGLCGRGHRVGSGSVYCNRLV